MPTYVYETIPANQNEEPRTYEISHSMFDPPLSQHPETGEPLRRLITGGFGISGSSSSSFEPPCATGGGCCCGHGACQQ